MNRYLFIYLLLVLFIGRSWEAPTIQLVNNPAFPTNGYTYVAQYSCTAVAFVKVTVDSGDSVSNVKSTQDNSLGTAIYTSSNSSVYYLLYQGVSTTATLKTLVVTTTQGLSASVNYTAQCVIQPAPAVKTKPTGQFISGGNSPDSNSIVIEYQALAYPLQSTQIQMVQDPYFSPPFSVYPGTNILEIPYIYYYGAIEDLSTATYNVIFNSSVASGYTVTTTSLAQTLKSVNLVDSVTATHYPSGSTFASCAKYSTFSYSGAANELKFLGYTNVVSSSSLVESFSLYPISGSPSGGAQYLGVVSGKQYTQLMGYNTTLGDFSVLDNFVTVTCIPNTVPTPTLTTTKPSAQSVSISYSSPGIQVLQFGMNTGFYTKFSYPFGYSSGTYSNPTFTFGIVTSANTYFGSFVPVIQWFKEAAKTPINLKAITTLTSSTTTSDTTAPLINKVEFVALGAENAIMRIYATDAGTGVNSIQVTDYTPVASTATVFYTLTVNNLVSGTVNNGVYEVVINYLGNKTFGMRISDFAYNVNNDYFLTDIFPLKNNYADSNLNPLIPAFPLYTSGYSGITTGSDIVQLSFAKNNVDVSTSSVTNQLYLKLKTMNPDSTIIFYPFFYHISTRQFPAFKGRYDSDLGMFVVKFTIPARLYSGIIDYKLYVAPNNFTNSALNTLVGSSSQLTVVSSNADQLGPIITQLTPFSSSVSVTTAPATIGYTLQITDGLNAFVSGVVRLASDYDHTGVTFFLDPSQAYDTNFYDVSMTINSTNCLNDQYYITYAKLVDSSGHITETFDPIYVNNIDPLYQLLNGTKYVNPITVTCPSAVTDTTPPTISNLLASPSTIDCTDNDLGRTVTISFTVTDSGSGVNIYRMPEVYLSTIGPLTSKCPTPTVTNSTAATADFSVSCVVPFGYGYSNIIGISVYGMTDNKMNLFGVPSSSSGVSIQTTATKFVPLLSSATQITYEGGSLTLYGFRFGSDASQTIIQIDLNDGAGFSNITSTYSLYSGVVLVFNAPAINDPYNIRVSVGSQNSNEILITPVAKIENSSTAESQSSEATTGGAGQNTGTATTGDSETNIIGTSSTLSSLPLIIQLMILSILLIVM